eukprot:gene13438-18017_t
MSKTLKNNFMGKIIYASPGSGKTFLVNDLDIGDPNNRIIDADDIILDVIQEISPRFIVKMNVHPGKNISRYFRYAANLANTKLYPIVIMRLRAFNEQGLTVLTGSYRLMPICDLIYIQTNSKISEGRSYYPEKETNELEESIQRNEIQRKQ